MIYDVSFKYSFFLPRLPLAREMSLPFTTISASTGRTGRRSDDSRDFSYNAASSSCFCQHEHRLIRADHFRLQRQIISRRILSTLSHMSFKQQLQWRQAAFSKRREKQSYDYFLACVSNVLIVTDDERRRRRAAGDGKADDSTRAEPFRPII